MCRQVYYKHHQKISSEDSAPQQLQFYFFFTINSDDFFVLSKIIWNIIKKKKNTHIHFITRLEMKLFVVIADSDFRSLGRFFTRGKMRVIQFFGSIIIWWWFSVLPIMDFYETFSSCIIHFFFFCYSCQYYTLNDPKSNLLLFSSLSWAIFRLLFHYY